MINNDFTGNSSIANSGLTISSNQSSPPKLLLQGSTADLE